MCEFRIQDCRHSPWRGLPQMAPWHHVGATMEITLDKNGSLYDPAGTESCDMQIRLVIYLDRMKLYIYLGLWWPPAAPFNCAQVRHHSPAGTFTRVPGRCLRWSPTSQGPRWPPAYRYIKYKKFYVYSDGTHTQMPVHRAALTHRRFYTEKPLHRATFTQRGFYTETPLHKEAFLHKRFYA